MQKVCDIPQVRQFSSSGEYPIELWQCRTTRRHILKIPNDDGITSIEIDFEDLVEWIRTDPQKIVAGLSNR